MPADTAKIDLFLSTPSARRATPRSKANSSMVPISIHALREEGDRASAGGFFVFLISIHALREEGDRRDSFTELDNGGFLSTPSARRATTTRQPPSIRSAYFYPRPPRGGRRSTTSELPFLAWISIHALREEGDEEGLGDIIVESVFLSTPSARRATPRPAYQGIQGVHFYPRPPRGGRPLPMGAVSTRRQFLSTPSARRATAKTETKSLFSYKLYNILHEFRRALIYNGSKNYPNHAK